MDKAIDKGLDDPVIKVEGLTKYYHKNVLAVDNVSFEVRRGEIFGLIGPDGAGKTTVLQVLAGVLKPSSGNVFVSGIEVTKDPEKIKPFIGYMPQGLGLNLYDNLTVEENISFFRSLREIPDEVFRQNKELLLEITGLKPFLSRQARALSGGMRQKLALVCTLLHLPKIIFLDEPTTGVDPLSRQEFWKIIHTLVQEKGLTGIIATSYMDEAERCHRIALMFQGKIILQGRPEEYPNLEEAFIQSISNRTKSSGAEKPINLKKPPLKSGSKEKLIVCKSVSKLFGDFRAVERVSLEVEKGEVLGLLGPNGAGKTTLIKMMCGLLEPTEGEIFIAGHNVEKEKAKLWQTIGYMSQRFSLYRDLTVMENVRLFAGLYGVRRKDFSSLLEKLGLSPWKDRLVKDIPFGIRQRVALLCAVLHEPVVVFLDEPTSGVDPLARRTFWEVIYRLSREDGITVIVSTHYMDEAENCDRIGLMNRGRLIALGTPEEIKKGAEVISGKLLQIKSPSFREVFGLLRDRFANLSLYGSKIYLRTFTPDEDRERIIKLFDEAGIRDYQIELSIPPLQEAFVDFILNDMKGDQT
ncbi:MAG: ATP-binding cassette domain-containing protein [Thermodesulfobacteriaceae bacterium]|jgi:ABC-2 type transport system ATP-binding protein